MTKKCPPGKIHRKRYTKRAHPRKSYKRGDGTRVRSTYVDRTHVHAACIVDVGKKGKGPKTLPQPSNKDISLRRMGYDTDDTARMRHNVLDKATNKHHPLKVLRHFVLRANIQTTGSKAKKIMENDVNYLQKIYKEYKKKHGSKKSTKSRKTFKKTSRKTSKKTSRKTSKKTARRTSRRTSRKTSKKTSRRTSRKTSRRKTSRRFSRKPIRKSRRKYSRK